MTKYFFIIAWTIYGGLLSAQYSDSVFYYIGFTSTGTFNKTNQNNSYLINNTLKLGAKKKNLTLNSFNKWLYGKQNNNLTNNDFASVWDINLHKTFPHFYYWGLVNYNTSYSLKTNNQLQTGAGIAYNFFDKKEITINISDGLLYDYSDVKLNDSANVIYGTPRNSFRLQIKSNVKDKLIFNGSSFLQNALQNQNDYIIKTDISLSVKLKKWLGVTATCSYNKMTRTNTENLFLTYGVYIEKYF